MCSGNIGVRQEVHRKLKERNIVYAEEIADYHGKVSFQPKPSFIILHGSAAEGLHGKWSGLHVVVLGDFDAPLKIV